MTPLIIAIITAFILSAALLHRYGDWKRQNAMIILVVLISWYFSLLTVLVLPLDITSNIYRQCLNTSENLNGSEKCVKPWINIPNDVLHRFWRLIYWSSQFLTWILLPLMQSYARAGEFTFPEKLKSAVKDNMLYYLSYLCICSVCLIYLIIFAGIPLDGSKLRAIASSASNTWGLFLLIILLGYALVDVPQKFWLLGDPRACLLRKYFQLSKITSDYYDAEAELKNLIQRIQVFREQIPVDGAELKYYADLVWEIVPTQFHRSSNRFSTSALSTEPSIETLVQYHKQLKSALHNFKKTLIQRERCFNEIYHLQKVNSNRKENYLMYKEYIFQGPMNWPDKWKKFFIDYLWTAISKPVFSKILSCIALVMSAAVVWSEALFFKKKPILSVFALIMSLAKENYNYNTIQILCFITLAYLCYCAYSTVFKIRIFNYYHFTPDHQTDENSLIFSGMLLSRLTPPLCLNFLGLIHMDSHIIKELVQETEYTQVMGHMDVISIISNGFNIYFPMVMIIISSATYFHIGSHLLSAIGFPQYLPQDEITDDIVTEGQRLALAEKDRRIRKGLFPQTESIEPNLRNSRGQFKNDNDETSSQSTSVDNTNTGMSWTSKNIFDDV